MIVERLARRGLGGQDRGRRLPSEKDSEDDDPLDPGAIVVLNEIIIGE